MALFRQFRGNRASLDAQPLHDGYAYFCVDDGTFHIDYADADGNLYRKQINAANAETLCGMTLEELKAELATQDAVVLAEAQAYTDAKIAENVITPEIMLAILDEAQLAQPVADGDNSVLTTEDDKILIL